MTVDELLDGILEREGPGTPPYLDPSDHGNRTAWGISERSHPDAWRHGPPSSTDAKVIYAKQYVQPFAPLVDAGLNDRVRIALVDDAVLSGVATAIRTLQQVLGVTVDGIIGPETIAALVAHQDANGWLLMELVKRRAHRLARIVERDHTQARFVVGWIDRCLSLL